MSDFKEYVVHYGYEGHQWGFVVKATSPEDAEARLKAIGAWGKVDGELVMTIPGGFGSGAFVRAVVWVRNLFGGNGWGER